MKGRATSLMALALTAALCAAANASPAAATTAAPTPASADIPAHPRQLLYPVLRYVAPVAADHRVVLPESRVAAYLAEDHTRPLVSLAVYFRVGDYLDPRERPGVADLTGYLLARGGVDGRRPMSADALDERLEFLAASLSSDMDDTTGAVSLNLLSKDLDEGLAILRDVLTAPRFQEDKLALRKDQRLADMGRRNDSSSSIESREREILAFGADHFSTKVLTKAELLAVKRADLQRFHRRYLHPRNFVVYATGDFDRAQMTRRLDELLRAWPFPGEDVPLHAPAPTHRLQRGVYLVDKPDVTQGRVSLLLPGIQRDDPDYYAVQLMNDILGGGGFTSRITNRVRSDEGLAYSAGSRFPGGIDYPGVFAAYFQSKPRSCAYAARIVLDELRRLREGGVTDEELAVAKRQLIDAVPRFFPSKEEVVRTLAAEELFGRYPREPEFYRRYPERVEAVTRAQVEAAAKKWLRPDEVALLVVGKKADLLNPDPAKRASFTELLPGVTTITELPLRDPLTQRPLSVTPGAR